MILKRTSFAARFFAASSLAWLGGCNDAVPVSPTSASPAPASYLVSGTVSEKIDGISRPLADRQLIVRIEQHTSGSTQTVSTDGNGRYTVRVPRSRVFLTAWNPPEQQPCLASAVVDKDTTIDVEIVPVRRSSTATTTGSPLITGFVYETTPEGRKPLPGAHISVDASSDVWVAYTRTDQTGRFFLCRVNAPVQMVVSAGNGYQDWWQSITGTTDMVLDIELKR